jgi:SAM-dependent methyltransferase
MQAFVQGSVGALKTAIHAAVNIERSYDRYFATGLYAARYPAPNSHVLSLVLNELGPGGGRILDFGCGNGRYALPLLEQPGVSIFAYDISAGAIQHLSRRYNELAQATERPIALETLCGSLDDLQRRLEGDCGFDLIVLLFGVLGHIEGRRRRVHTLNVLRNHLRPSGRLIVTVPNRARRFLAEQEAALQSVANGEAEKGDIRYHRGGDQNRIDLYYHLYSPREFRSELAEAGFEVSSLRPESVLSERAVLSAPLGAATDRLLRRVVPVSLAYGFVATAQAPVRVPLGAVG